MVRLYVFLVACLASIAIVKAISSTGERLNGDETLLSELVQTRVTTGQARITRSFPGKIITRIELKPILSITEDLFDLKILEGGVFSNFVDLEVKCLNFISIPLRIKIYGMTVVPGDALENDVSQLE